ncbi:hypothetical protein ACLQ3F_03455 [Micromonospora sp. DT15]|uniref:hypothetical protein n=1 Tax=Micromonospora sp. DT15 TaxID=3393445 RepID=UPI003CE79A6C
MLVALGQIRVVTGGLEGEQFGVPAAGGDEVGVCAVLDEPAVVQDEDPVGVPDVGEPVRDEDRGGPTSAVIDVR